MDPYLADVLFPARRSAEALCISAVHEFFFSYYEFCFPAAVQHDFLPLGSYLRFFYL